MEKIYVSDANIFIGMHRVGMIDCLFYLSERNKNKKQEIRELTEI